MLIQDRVLFITQTDAPRPHFLPAARAEVLGEWTLRRTWKYFEFLRGRPPFEMWRNSRAKNPFSFIILLHKSTHTPHVCCVPRVHSRPSMGRRHGTCSAIKFIFFEMMMMVEGKCLKSKLKAPTFPSFSIRRPFLDRRRRRPLPLLSEAP